MSSVSIGKNIKLSIFGESHGKCIGGVADGFPYGMNIDLEKLKKFMKRRAPGNNNFVTERVEEDQIKFLSGIRDNTIMGDPLSLIIENKNANSTEYKEMNGIPRPSHIDFSAIKKYGEYIQLEGGGHFSGRLTAVITAFGGIAKQLLETHNIHILAHLYRIRNILDTEHNLEEDMINKYKASEENRYSVINEENIEIIDQIISELKQKGDSTGGVVECSVFGLDAGIGEPIFDGIENNISKMIFSIPGIKGIEFGSGFDGAVKLGSENNDEFYIDENKQIKTRTNHSGGILGGISNGMPITFKVAFKPTPSIKKEQNTIDLYKNEETSIKINGRHDPCIAIRGVPVVEAVTAIVILDYLVGKYSVRT